MSGLVVQAVAIKLVNKRGGYYKGKHVTGSDYAVFECPRCGHRNNACVYSAESTATPEGRIPFKCHMCRVTVEVAAPFSKQLIVKPEDLNMLQTKGSADLNSTIVGRSY